MEEMEFIIILEHLIRVASDEIILGDILMDNYKGEIL